MPAWRALPYPRSATCTTRAPCSAAIRGEPSELPLSATTISPDIPASSRARRAFPRHTARVSASLRQGITTETSGGSDPAAPAARSGARSSAAVPAIRSGDDPTPAAGLRSALMAVAAPAHFSRARSFAYSVVLVGLFFALLEGGLRLARV